MRCSVHSPVASSLMQLCNRQANTLGKKIFLYKLLRVYLHIPPDTLLVWKNATHNPPKLSASLPQLIFCYSTYEFKPPKYGSEEYPEWAVNVGWALAGVSVLQIPIWGVAVLFYYFSQGVSRSEEVGRKFGV